MIDIFQLTQQSITALNIELVDVERAPMGVLRVTIDKPGGVDINDCEQVSKHLSHVYEVEDVDYKRLEVSSPGIDRPLKTQDDFVRFSGSRIELKLYEAINSKKVFVGVLNTVESSIGDNNDADQGNDLNSDQVQFQLTYQADNGKDCILNFVFDDVDRAKLDPILDFKGKKR